MELENLRGQHKQKDECFILIKAQPHRSSKYFETVCCAGVGRDGKWRRQYPVPFRILDETQKFRRWDWIEYDFVRSANDKRIESQKVISETLHTTGEKLKKTERATILNPLIRESFAEADAKGESLTLLRPKEISLDFRKKTPRELQEETDKHADLAKQLSFFDKTAKPMKPCPMQFMLNWTDQTGRRHRHTNDDWETSAAYNRFAREYGQQRAIKILKEKYEQTYFNAGLVLGFSTHSRRNVTYGTNNQWLLVGLIRLDENKQSDLFIN